MAVPQHSILREFVGRVIEIASKYKAIVQFQLDNKTERALLLYDKLKVNGEPLPEGDSINSYIEEGTLLKFLCHNFDDKGVDSKLFMAGKRVSAKANLTQLPGLEEGRPLGFDAVPCDPSDNDGRCNWFATVVWKGRKPVMDYDDVHNVRNKPSDSLQLSEIKLVTSNPHSMFLRTEGQIMKILNAEYGLALGAIKTNCWESILFHRSQATLFDRSLAKEDLTTIFEEGDKIRLVAAAAPKKMGVRWVASQVRVLVASSVNDRFQF